ncbi:MAG TPA: flagellar hook-length control protein FliK [Planctomycetota bacterium]|nr:flagellar hook-length control protein FliK [Planctomycetota bacterium]
MRPRGDSAPAPALRPMRAPPVGGSIRPDGGGAKPVPPKDIVRQAAEALQSAPIRDGTRVRLSLSPAHLGDLCIELSVSGSRLRGRVRTQTPAARDLILAHLDDLRRELERRGIRWSRFEVEVDLSWPPEGDGPEGSGRPLSPRRQVLDLRA